MKIVLIPKNKVNQKSPYLGTKKLAKVEFSGVIKIGFLKLTLFKTIKMWSACADKS